MKDKFKLTGRHKHPEGTIVRVGRAEFGSKRLAVIAGPCAVEDEKTMMHTAEAVATCGAKGLRGGAYKPRTSPYSFQGLGEKGLELLRRAADAYSLIAVTEVLDVRDVETVCKYTDVIQVGARNMQNFPLLRELGGRGVPVLLKRGMGATIEEWLLSAEYILLGGNPDVILCERGVRSFDPARPIIPDISAIPLVKRMSHLPVIFDPSHSTGRSEEVTTASCAAVGAGADGLIVEVHCEPAEASSDGEQTLSPVQFADMMERVRVIAAAVGRSL